MSNKTPRGKRSVDTVLDAALEQVSREGLDSITIGQLAVASGMSKAGLFAHFGSRENLQLATIERARTRFIDVVIAPSLVGGGPRTQLLKIVDNWIAYLGKLSEVGGCPLGLAQIEFARREGPINTRLAEVQRELDAFLSSIVTAAVEAKEIAPQVNAVDVVFQLEAIMAHALFRRQLLHDEDVYARAKELFTALI